MDKEKIFEIELSRWNPSGANPLAGITLPATPYELADTLERAGITGDTVYSVEVLSSQMDYLPQFIQPDINLHELNHLAQRLSSLSEWDLDCFEGTVMMDAVQTQYAPIPAERLINMTHSTDQCQIAYEAYDDPSLGKFYADNDFVPALEKVSDEVYAYLDFGKIGKEMREGEGGVFMSHGYVVQNGEIAADYHSGDAVSLEKPDYAVLLRVTKGYFSGPAQDSEPAVYLKLPATDAALINAMDAVGAASPEECAFSAEDCMAPFLTEKINDALYASEGGCYGLVNELAEQLRQLETENRLPTYKAMLEEAPGDLSLEEALDLASMTEEFKLLSDSVSPAEYAKKEIQRMLSLSDDNGLILFCNLDNYGRYLLEQRGAAETEYGLLEPQNGMTVDQCLNRPGQSFGMEMK
ncbi:antirestriction protein ArdA [Hydrogenoanaerobacterium sp.]|uniref:antirestriction protein ArdA n=1 Tax=Hydrogenoanaerobacterium sp. TaxID=2953763 RepID=UPI00289ECB3C|nr:antirestriction protein ArdA [Hydrogenoanaerobacterium sp.]